MILPPETVSSTWTGPHWVEATAPVTWALPLVDPLPFPDDEPDDEPDVVPDPELPEDEPDEELDELDVPVDPPVPDTMAGGLAVVVVLEAS